MEKVVYTHRRNDNNQIFYVGIGNQYRPFVKQRSSEWNSIANEFGYSVDVVKKGLSTESARELEKKLISDIGIDNLVNKNIGGGGPIKHTNSTKDLMSKSQKGKFFSESTRKKLSEAKLGKLNPMSGGHTEETKRKISESCKGKVNTPEQRLKQSKAQMKSVGQYKDGNLIKVYDSIQSASSAVDGWDSAISRVCNGKSKSHKGFEWEYIKH
jgi:hypothetical protein